VRVSAARGSPVPETRFDDLHGARGIAGLPRYALNSGLLLRASRDGLLAKSRRLVGRRRDACYGRVQASGSGDARSRFATEK
jgi:hypothetical protein